MFVTIGYHLLASLALVLTQPKHVLQALFMYAVLAISQHQSLLSVFYPQLAKTALRLLDVIVIAEFLGFEYFFIRDRKKFWEGDGVGTLF